MCQGKKKKRKEKKKIKSIFRQAELCKVEEKEFAGRVIKLNYKMQKSDWAECREDSTGGGGKKNTIVGRNARLYTVIPFSARQNTKHVRNRYINFQRKRKK